MTNRGVFGTQRSVWAYNDREQSARGVRLIHTRRKISLGVLTVNRFVSKLAIVLLGITLLWLANSALVSSFSVLLALLG